MPARNQYELWVRDVADYFKLTKKAEIKLYFIGLRAKKLWGMEYLYQTFSTVRTSNKDVDSKYMELLWSLKTK